MPFFLFFFSSIVLILKYIMTPLLRYKASANLISRIVAAAAIIVVVTITAIRIIIVRIKMLKRLAILDKGVSINLMRSRTVANPYIVARRTICITIQAIFNALGGS